MTVVGARPQFIKAGILSKSSKANLMKFASLVSTTMLICPMYFTELGIKEPKYNLNVGSSSHKQTAQMMVGIEEVIEQEKPDGV